jgi:hypothetical protein
MRQQLMPERIVSQAEKPLSAKDIQLLKNNRNKQFLFLLSAYLPLVCIGIFVLLEGPQSLNEGRHSSNYQVHLNAKLRSRFWTVAPYVLSFFFIMLTFYFGKLYFQTIRPLNMDLKKGMKDLFFFKPAKNPMAFFNKYYLSTPLYNNQQIEVSREDFENIATTDELCLEVGPASKYILRLMNREKEINYY